MSSSTLAAASCACLFLASRIALVELLIEFTAAACMAVLDVRLKDFKAPVASKNLMEFWEGNNQKIKKGRHFGISSSEEMPSFPLRG